MKFKTFAEFLYKAGTDAIAAVKFPSRMKMLRRAAERAADELTSVKLEAESTLTDKLEYLVKEADEDEAVELIKELALLEREIEEADGAAKNVAALVTKLEGPAPEGSKEE